MLRVTVTSPSLCGSKPLYSDFRYVESGKTEGARLLAGGARHGDTGFFVQPTVFADVGDEMKICREEIFGPVQSIQRVKNMEEAIARANKNT